MLEKYAIDEFLNNDECYMKCDVYLKDNNYYIDIDAPGYDKNNLLVEYSNGYITVTVTKKEMKEDNKKYIKKERCYGIYKRQFYVGEIDTTKISAKYRDGVLYLVIPKAKIGTSKIISIK